MRLSLPARRPFLTPIAALLLALAQGPAWAHPPQTAEPLPARPAAPPVWPGGDPSIRPQDDMFQYANGAWLRETQIPADKRAYGTFLLLRERSDAEVRALLEEAASSPGKDPDARLVGACYGALLDLPRIESQGLRALGEELSRIDQVLTPASLARQLGRLGTLGVTVPLGAWVSPDANDPTVNTVYWTHGGLGLPDREDYLNPDAQSEARRKAYQSYLTTVFDLLAQDTTAPTLAPLGFESSAAAAAAVLQFEKSLAEIHWKRADRRDPLKTYNPSTLADIEKAYPGFPWASFASSIGMPEQGRIVLREPSFFRDFGGLVERTPTRVWKAYMRAHLLDDHAVALPAAYRIAHHRFHGEALQGLAAPPPRWQTAVRETNAYLGEAVGKRFVTLHFPPAAKARMQTLVGHLLQAYRTGLEQLAWMTPETRRAALGKLDGLTVKIGYPDRWRGYPGLLIRREDALGNALRSARYQYAREMAEAGKPVDRSRWLMDPQVVNAYYNPLGNEIVFPAAILRPPFFDLNGDAAYNYGAIGSVIGHEISHGFDDSGRRYDADGRLRDWWTPADETAFNARAEKLVAQYGAYQAMPDLKVDGKLTLGENIADLAGVAMAHRAYMQSIKGQTIPNVDGFSPSQRFFMGYARVWRSKSRPEWLRTRVMTDPHSPETFRVNGVLTNLDAFHEAFGLKLGDGLFKPETERVRLW